MYPCMKFRITKNRFLICLKKLLYCLRICCNIWHTKFKTLVYRTCFTYFPWAMVSKESLFLFKRWEEILYPCLLYLFIKEMIESLHYVCTWCSTCTSCVMPAVSITEVYCSWSIAFYRKPKYWKGNVFRRPTRLFFR